MAGLSGRFAEEVRRRRRRSVIVERMEAMRRAAIECFGAIHGVIHAAGRPPGGLIQLKTREAAGVAALECEHPAASAGR